MDYERFQKWINNNQEAYCMILRIAIKKYLGLKGIEQLCFDIGIGQFEALDIMEWYAGTHIPTFDELYTLNFYLKWKFPDIYNSAVQDYYQLFLSYLTN